MATSRSYEYGRSGVTLSALQLNRLSEIESVARNEFELNPGLSGLAYPIYSMLLEILPKPSMVFDKPQEYVKVYDWIEGAIDVNRNEGIFAKYIHNYTAHQYNLRFGGVNESKVKDLVNQASNAIGLTLAQRILENNGALPSIEGLGAVDAGESARTVFINPRHYPEGDYTGWAGTLLFSFLGYHRFFKEWLLDHERVIATIDTGVGEPLVRTTKNLEGTYDLFAAIQAHTLAVDDYTMREKLIAFLKRKVNADTAQLLGLTADYVANMYGLEQSSPFSVEDLLPFASPYDYQYAQVGIHVGSLNNDLIDKYSVAPYKNLVVHAGKGDDYVYSPDYIANGISVLYDGGDGTDRLSMSRVSQYQKVVLENIKSELFSWRFTVGEVGNNNPIDTKVLAYSVEQVMMGGTSNWFSVSRLNSPTSDILVNLGLPGAYGNTLDF